MKIVQGIGVGTLVLGLIGIEGAIETDYGWEFSLCLVVIGGILSIVGLIAQFHEEINEDYRKFYSDRNGNDNDASYPSYLRR